MLFLEGAFGFGFRFKVNDVRKSGNFDLFFLLDRLVDVKQRVVRGKLV